MSFVPDILKVNRLVVVLIVGSCACCRAATVNVSGLVALGGTLKRAREDGRRNTRCMQVVKIKLQVQRYILHSPWRCRSGHAGSRSVTYILTRAWQARFLLSVVVGCLTFICSFEQPFTPIYSLSFFHNLR
ncbi:hypothetical protein FH972_024247 [Carpinus fangiana]|uniref:Secreted protein n=1 Tax=Carpinus fangiana TaxID=176857 RepID=A0A5N6KXI0_9ROSI|nr:hypothetical protein FH972_024247 [Carpinus fangiana]